MKRQKMKRNFWKRNEVKCMLSVFKDLNICQLIEQKTLPINDIYKRVEIEMKRRGYKMKTGKQIQSKWSQMKSAYICIKRNHKADFYAMKDPEFRDDVAELVEADPAMKVSIPPLLPLEECPSPSPSASGMEEEGGVQEQEEPMDDNEDGEEHLQCIVGAHEALCVVDESPDAACEIVAKPVQKMEKARKVYESPRKQGSYKKSFVKFMQQLKALEVELQDEFLMKQTRLLAQERKLQIQRDNLIISAFVSNTNEILRTTQELLAKDRSLTTSP